MLDIGDDTVGWLGARYLPFPMTPGEVGHESTECQVVRYQPGNVNIAGLAGAGGGGALSLWL